MHAYSLPTKVKNGSNKSWIGRTLGGRYEILDIIEEGGMGVVYRARQIAIDREVAIKMLRSHVANEPRWVERFHREAKACSRLAHPNTIRLYDYGQTTRGEFYMVMELLKGRSLHTLINEEAPISAPRVLRILMQCCASLSEAHGMGIIHRDIKPENIYIQQLAGTRDFVTLFDFSIAKHTNLVLTAVGTIIGTPEYMSPEQASGVSVDHRSDIYSLGVVAYIMLKGGLLFHAAAPLDVLKMHQSKSPPPLPDHVPAPVAKLVMSCLAKKPDDRPSTALELLEAAQVWLTEIDPAVDLASDPSVRNTLLTMNATADMSQSDMAMPSKPIVRTMLGTVGAMTDFSTSSFSQPKPRPKTMLHSAGGPGARPQQPMAMGPGSPIPSALPGVEPAPQATSIAEAPPSYPAVDLYPEEMTAQVVNPGFAKIPSPPDLPLIEPRGKSPLFWVVCVLLALSCGVGIYFLTTLLR